VADVFLSYAAEDRPHAARLAEALTSLGWRVWWDRDAIAGVAALRTIERELEVARCVIVLWSRSSVHSRSVREEAAAGRKALLSVLIDDVKPPATPKPAETLNLMGWKGGVNDPEFRPLPEAIRRRLPIAFERRPLIARAKPDQPKVVEAKSPRPIVQAPPQQESPTPQHDPPPPSPATTIFLCYRREDTQDAAGRLHDRLTDAYGANSVFMDIDSVPLGADFVDHVSEQVASCRAAIVMIGRNWLEATDKRGRRRLDNPDDLVRAEIAAALKQKIPVIPVLVQNAEMPTAEDLTEDIRPLARRNGIELRHTEWRTGVERLLKELDRVMGARRSG
jgi:hypothetical protein